MTVIEVFGVAGAALTVGVPLSLAYHAYVYPEDWRSLMAELREIRKNPVPPSQKRRAAPVAPKPVR